MAPWFEVFAVGQRNCREQAWVLKNSFQGISITKFVRKLLNVRSPQTLEFAEITALVPFSTPTGDFAQNGIVGEIAILRQSLRRISLSAGNCGRLFPCRGGTMKKRKLGKSNL